MNADNRRLDRLSWLALLSLLLLPWYKVRGGFFGFGWIGDAISEPDLWPGAFQAIMGRWQLWPVLLLFAAAMGLRLAQPSGAVRGRWLIRIGIVGLVWLVAEGLSSGMRCWNWSLPEAISERSPGNPLSARAR